jgi:hypothetical protein
MLPAHKAATGGRAPEMTRSRCNAAMVWVRGRPASQELRNCMLSKNTLPVSFGEAELSPMYTLVTNRTTPGRGQSCDNLVDGRTTQAFVSVRFG